MDINRWHVEIGVVLNEHTRQLPMGISCRETIGQAINGDNPLQPVPFCKSALDLWP